MDIDQPSAYFRPMRIWIRLATLCLSLALLGGAILHDAASARMSFDMANSGVADMDTAAAVAADDNCPACISGETTAVACDLDCTAPVLLSVTVPDGAVKAVRRSALISVVAPSPEGLDLGVDPTPPRSSLLI